MAKVGAEFDEGMGDVHLVDVGQTEFLQAGRVDDVAVVVKMIEACMGGSVLAGIQRLGNLARVACAAGSSALMMLDLPMPDCPTSTLVSPCK